MRPTVEELGILEGVADKMGGWLATFVVLGLIVGVGLAVIWIMVTRSGRPQEDLLESIVGKVGKAITPVTTTHGKVRVGGQVLRALATTNLEAQSEVRVVAVDGMIAKVVPASEPWPPPAGDAETKVGGPPAGMAGASGDSEDEQE